MNTQLLINQLTVAILSSAIAIPTIQRFKNWIPNQRFVELFSVIVSGVIGFVFSVFYTELGMVDAGFVAFYSVVGAEGIYKLLGEKLQTYQGKDVPYGIEPKEVNEDFKETVG